LFFDPRSLATERQKCAALHAKCVVVDGADVFVSSANFTEAAQQRNIEVGLLLHSSAIANRLTRFFESLVASGHFQRVV
jgi:phosphatidylserine/phosphatidylglycerophosphate/cardiolipin synthase-like enzyme